MWYLISQFWIWLLAALACGVVAGWITYQGRDDAFWRGLIPWGILLGVGSLVATLRVFKDGGGFWIDLGMLLAGFYFVGCFLGHFLRMRRQRTEPALAQENSSAHFAGIPVAATPLAGGAAAGSDLLDSNDAAARLPEQGATEAVPKELAVEPSKPHATAPKTAEASEEAITGLSMPRLGKPDDLTRIYGIDGETERRLNSLGIFHHDQIAAMTPGQRRWLFRQLGYNGRFPSWWWRWKYDAEQVLLGQQNEGSQSPSEGKTTLKAGTHPHAKGENSPVSDDQSAIATLAHGSEPPPPHGVPSVATTEQVSAASLPDAAPRLPSMEGHAGTKPIGLAGPRGAKADDLKRIRGIGRQNEGRLHALGVWHFDQIAVWSEDEVKWVGSYLSFSGRIEREDWVGQAKVLAAGQDTEFSKRVDKGLVETSADAGDKGQGNIAKLEKPVRKPPAQS
ncbi:hypothetical protein MCEMSEM23_00841 [Rhabdaerophilaceae bacterium]